MADPSVLKKQSIDVGEIHEWLHEEHIFSVIEKAEVVCNSYPLIGQTDEQGNPTIGAIKAFRDIQQLSKSVGVFKSLQSQIESLTAAE